MTLRTRCLVLRQVESLKGLATLDTVCERLPEIERSDVQKALYNLLAQDRIFKGSGKIVGSSGRPQFFYLMNDNWSSNKDSAKRERASGRKYYKGEGGELATNTAKGLGTVRYRDRKIKLLLKLRPMVTGTDADLLIGLLADLGHKAT